LWSQLILLVEILNSHFSPLSGHLPSWTANAFDLLNFITQLPDGVRANTSVNRHFVNKFTRSDEHQKTISKLGQCAGSPSGLRRPAAMT
jgi:hypothetical protein